MSQTFKAIRTSPEHPAQPKTNPNSSINKANTKNGKKPDRTPSAAVTPTPIHKRPAWIDLENTKIDACFRIMRANPEHRDTFEKSNIPLPSPKCGRRHGAIYSPNRGCGTGSTSGSQVSTSTSSPASRFGLVVPREEDERKYFNLPVDRGLPPDMCWAGSSGEIAKRDLAEVEAARETARNVAKAKLILEMPLGRLEEEIQDSGAFEHRLSEVAEKEAKRWGFDMGGECCSRDDGFW
ncbi:hypothetical protein BDW62DRAFT_179828 [Aspergillus aurantiobrunneus]